MVVITHPLFLIALSSFVTWLVCRWWYGRKTRPCERIATVEGLPDGKSVGPLPSEAEPADVLRVATLGGAPVRPFLDTAPLSHLSEPGSR
jgi:hypothetical protein